MPDFTILLVILAIILSLFTFLFAMPRFMSGLKLDRSPLAKKLNLSEDKIKAFVPIYGRGAPIKDWNAGYTSQTWISIIGWKRIIFIGTDEEFIFVSYGGGADLKIGPLTIGKGGILRIPANDITSLAFEKKGVVIADVFPPDVYTMKFGKDSRELEFFALPGPFVDVGALKAFLEPFLK